MLFRFPVQPFIVKRKRRSYIKREIGRFKNMQSAYSAVKHNYFVAERINSHGRYKRAPSVARSAEGIKQVCAAVILKKAFSG